jgi:hypothetical protein
MQGPLDMDVLAPLIESDDHPIEIVRDEDRVWCRHCWASIVGPARLPLTRERLAFLLEREGVDPAAYCLDGGHPDERYVVDHRGREWVTYYSERGHEAGLCTFARAADAYQHLLDQLIRDPTTRKRSR